MNCTKSCDKMLLGSFDRSAFSKLEKQIPSWFRSYPSQKSGQIGSLHWCFQSFNLLSKVGEFTNERENEQRLPAVRRVNCVGRWT